MCLFRIQLSILRPTAGLTHRRSPTPAIDPLARAGARDGDGFWSNALAVYARDQGPRMTNLGNVQEIFSRTAPLNDAGLLFAPWLRLIARPRPSGYRRAQPPVASTRAAMRTSAFPTGQWFYAPVNQSRVINNQEGLRCHLPLGNQNPGVKNEAA